MKTKITDITIAHDIERMIDARKGPHGGVKLDEVRECLESKFHNLSLIAFGPFGKDSKHYDRPDCPHCTGEESKRTRDRYRYADGSVFMIDHLEHKLGLGVHETWLQKPHWPKEFKDIADKDNVKDCFASDFGKSGDRLKNPSPIMELGWKGRGLT